VANNKEPYILISLYENLYLKLYGKKPTMNKYREKWAMQDVVDSVGLDRAKQIMNYYFKTSKSGHPLGFFYMNFDRLGFMMDQINKDKENRERLLEQTRKLVSGEE